MGLGAKELSVAFGILGWGGAGCLCLSREGCQWADSQLQRGRGPQDLRRVEGKAPASLCTASRQQHRRHLPRVTHPLTRRQQITADAKAGPDLASHPTTGVWQRAMGTRIEDLCLLGLLLGGPL